MHIRRSTRSRSNVSRWCSARHKGVPQGVRGQQEEVLVYGGRHWCRPSGSRRHQPSCAREFAAEGCKLALCDNDPAELHLARQELAGRGVQVIAIRCDVTNMAQVDGMVEEVVNHYGWVDVLVNNAGPAQTGAALEMTLEDFEQAMEAMFWGVVYPTRAVLPHMLERRAGRIVNIMLSGGKFAANLLPQDCAKFAAIGFSEGLRTELLKENIAVVTVAPGRVSLNEARAARQIVTATERGEANGMSPHHQPDVLRVLGDALNGHSQQSKPLLTALAAIGRIAARRYLHQ